MPRIPLRVLVVFSVLSEEDAPSRGEQLNREHRAQRERGVAELVWVRAAGHARLSSRLFDSPHLWLGRGENTAFLTWCDYTFGTTVCGWPVCSHPNSHEAARAAAKRPRWREDNSIVFIQRNWNDFKPPGSEVKRRNMSNTILGWSVVHLFPREEGINRRHVSFRQKKTFVPYWHFKRMQCTSTVWVTVVLCTPTP